jgi:hypothetical protein
MDLFHVHSVAEAADESFPRSYWIPLLIICTNCVLCYDILYIEVGWSHLGTYTLAYVLVRCSMFNVHCFTLRILDLLLLILLCRLLLREGLFYRRGG